MNGPRSDFSDPIAALIESHHRIEHTLASVLALAREVHGAELSLGQRSTLELALEELGTEVPRHLQDEMDSLFPRIRSAPSPQVDAVRHLLDGLQTDRVLADERQRDIEVLIYCWLSDGELPAPKAQHLIMVIKELAAIYQKHIGTLNTVLFPLAGDILTEPQIQDIGREMAERRGIHWEDSPEDQEASPGASPPEED